MCGCTPAGICHERVCNVASVTLGRCWLPPCNCRRQVMCKHPSQCLIESPYVAVQSPQLQLQHIYMNAKPTPARFSYVNILTFFSIDRTVKRSSQRTIDSDGAYDHLLQFADNSHFSWIFLLFSYRFVFAVHLL